MLNLKLLLCCGLWIAITACQKTAPPAVAAPEATPVATVSIASQPTAATAPTDNFDACTLLTREEIGEVQGSPVTDTKSSARTSGATTVAQCFYTTSEFSRSVSLTVTRPVPEINGGRGPRDIWHETFGRFSEGANGDEGDHEKDGDHPAGGGEREREKESKPPLKIGGVGEEAFWTSGVGGTLYVVKANSFIRIGIGSVAKDEEKLNQATALAVKAIQRLE